MNGKADITIWKGSLNFMVYKTDKKIEFDELEKIITKHNWNPNTQDEGWLADKAYFKNDDNSIAAFLYSTFRKDYKLSREVGSEIKIAEPTGLSFYLNEKLIIASTASDSVLHHKVEKKMFDTLALVIG